MKELMTHEERVQWRLYLMGCIQRGEASASMTGIEYFDDVREEAERRFHCENISNT